MSTTSPIASSGDAAQPAHLQPARVGLPLALLWLSGMALRITVLAVPPVVPLLHADLHLSETEIGILSAMPALLFALAAVPGSLLIARWGAVATLVAGLLLNAAGSAARGAAGTATALYAASVLMGLGVALMQPALPALVRTWLPQRIGFGSAVYTNGLLIGETLVVALTIPVVLPLVGGSWRLDFLFWAVPVLATGLLAAVLAPRPGATSGGIASPARRWWPDWRRSFLWRLGLILGGVNSSYFLTNHFLPDYLTATGQSDLIGPALTSLNFLQLPASFLMLIFAGRLALRSWAYVATGSLALLGLIGMVSMTGFWVVAWAGVMGFALATTLVLALAVPALVSRADDVHRTSAGMFAISYTVSVVAPIVGGALWDLSGVPLVGFAPVALCLIAVAVIAATTNFARERS
jgi:CP family cyanate transporter-like MFS transporter